MPKHDGKPGQELDKLHDRLAEAVTEPFAGIETDQIGRFGRATQGIADIIFLRDQGEKT